KGKFKSHVSCRGHAVWCKEGVMRRAAGPQDNASRNNRASRQGRSDSHTARRNGSIEINFLARLYRGDRGSSYWTYHHSQILAHVRALVRGQFDAGNLTWTVKYGMRFLISGGDLHRVSHIARRRQHGRSETQAVDNTLRAWWSRRLLVSNVVFGGTVARDLERHLLGFK